METKTGRDMDRRDFLKGAMVAGMVAATAATVSATGCSSSSSSGASGGSADSASTDASAGETATGATQGSVDWPGTPLDLSAVDITETQDCEVLICGLGAGGSVAACACAQNGLNTIAIEKSGKCGSVKTYICAIDSAPQQAAGLAFDRNRIAKEFVRYADGFANQKLINMYLDESSGLIDWIDATFKDDGVVCYSEYDIGDGWHDIYQLWPVQVDYHITYNAEIQAKLDAITDPDPAAKILAAPGIADFAVEHAQNAGANLLYQTKLVQLIQDTDGKVTGALAQSVDDEHYIQINASKGVILATGGYESDPDLLAYLNPAGARMGGFDMSSGMTTGDGIRAGIWAGGSKDMNPTFMTFERAALPVGAEPGYPYQGSTLWIGDQPFLKVNKVGQRFCNETSPYDWPLHADSLEPGHIFCSIWDSNYVDSIKTFHTLGCSRIDPSPTPGSTEGLSFEVLEMQLKAAEDAGCVVSADTVEELATKLQMDSATLSATVKRYNELCAAGSDDDFGKPAKDMIALGNPPYYGCFFGGHVLCTIDGLRINEDCQVISADDESPIEGLYATGNCSGSFYSVTYPELFWGNANGRTCTFALHIANKLAGK